MGKFGKVPLIPSGKKNADNVFFARRAIWTEAEANWRASSRRKANGGELNSIWNGKDATMKTAAGGVKVVGLIWKEKEEDNTTNEPIFCVDEFCKRNREGNLWTLNPGAGFIGKKWKFKNLSVVSLWNCKVDGKNNNVGNCKQSCVKVNNEKDWNVSCNSYTEHWSLKMTLNKPTSWKVGTQSHKIEVKGRKLL